MNLRGLVALSFCLLALCVGALCQGTQESAMPMPSGESDLMTAVMPSVEDDMMTATMPSVEDDMMTATMPSIEESKMDTSTTMNDTTTTTVANEVDLTPLNELMNGTTTAGEAEEEPIVVKVGSDPPGQLIYDP